MMTTNNTNKQDGTKRNEKDEDENVPFFFRYSTFSSTFETTCFFFFLIPL